jgi:hypothetical protein
MEKIEESFIDDNGNLFEIKTNIYGRSYCKNGSLHREDGPAYESTTSAKYWSIDGRFHRENGPAVILFKGEKMWFYKGRKIDCEIQEEFEQIIKLKLINGE